MAKVKKIVEIFKDNFKTSTFIYRMTIFLIKHKYQEMKTD